jgi:hypothetical protein
LLFEKKWEMVVGGEGDLEMVVKEEMVVVAKGKLLKSRCQFNAIQCQESRAQERSTSTAIRAERVPAFSNP